MKTKIYSNVDIHLIVQTFERIKRDHGKYLHSSIKVFREENPGDDNCPYIPPVSIYIDDAQPIVDFLVNECNIKPTPKESK